MGSPILYSISLVQSYGGNVSGSWCLCMGQNGIRSLLLTQINIYGLRSFSTHPCTQITRKTILSFNSVFPCGLHGGELGYTGQDRLTRAQTMIKERHVTSPEQKVAEEQPSMNDRCIALFWLIDGCARPDFEFEFSDVVVWKSGPQKNNYSRTVGVYEWWLRFLQCIEPGWASKHRKHQVDIQVGGHLKSGRAVHVACTIVQGMRRKSK